MLTREWVAQNVVPNIYSVYREVIAGILGRALVWLAFSENKDWLPNPLWIRIVDAVQTHRRTPDDTNPIRQRLQVVTGKDAVVHIESVEAEDKNVNTDDNNQPTVVTPNATPIANRNRRGSTTTDCLLQTVLANQRKQQITLNDMQTSIAGMQGQLRGQQRSFARLTRRIDSNPINMMRRQAVSPTRIQQTRNQHLSPQRQNANVNNNATLAPNVPNLQQLWQEYIHGLGGRKAAKDFTAYERGQCKCKYSRRKIFWDVVAANVRAQRLATDVIDNLYAYYGANQSVTTIINKLRKDKRQGTLPPSVRL